jgi:hypothetical protein
MLDATPETIAAVGAVGVAYRFFAATLLPAAKELGQLFKDNIVAWRQENARAIVESADRKLLSIYDGKVPDGLKMNPRVACTILEKGSWSDDAVVQDYWAGLLATSCDQTGKDETSLIFISVLESLTAGQVRILKYLVETCEKRHEGEALFSVPQLFDFAKLREVHGNNPSFTEIDISLDHMRMLELTGDKGGFLVPGLNPDDPKATITVTGFAINLYLRAEGIKTNGIEYWGLQGKKSNPGEQT